MAGQSEQDNQFDEVDDWTRENKLFDRWIFPVAMKLGGIKHERVKACSICSVPKKVRRCKVEAYKPKVVSIGPLHRGTNRDLQYMEEIKWRCSHSLFSRTPQAKESLKRCSKAILELVEVVSATYLDDIKIESNELAKIMLLDGCFLLELLMCSDTKLIRELQSNFPGPGSDVLKQEEVLSDLKLLENQIPLFILDALFIQLFSPKRNSKDDLKRARKTINEWVLFLFGYASRDNSTSQSQDQEDSHVPETAHFLEHIHWYITQKEDQDEKEDQDDQREHIVSFGAQESSQPQFKSKRQGFGSAITRAVSCLNVPRCCCFTTFSNCNSKHFSETKPKLKYCATRLIAGGVTIAPRDHQDNPLVLGCCKKFCKTNKRLEIHPLHISAKTEVELRNFIAWEQSRITHRKFSEEKTGCAFSEYVSLLKDLVCCEQDIILLKTKKVLTVNEAENRSNEDLMNFLRAIVRGIQIDAGVNSRFGKTVSHLNQYSGPGINLTILWHHFQRFLAWTRRKCRSLYQTLKRDHTSTMWKTIGVLAAVVLLFLTVAQTVFAALGL
ncbi:hypothetical protein VNO77_07600 [Canavalia gladiata]|uniref:Uncharacterized protein n=1 Tax=Canavalia gladiata TaxID=3824 RepID=A0AAN9M7S4_CANGL